MTALKRPIGILGGTFDPIHFGHLRTALEIQQAFHLSEVQLIPCYQPVHRSLPQASALLRLQMLRLAVEQEACLKADSVEVDRQCPSYTIDTLELIRKTLPDTPLCLILGIDAFLSFTSWRRYQDILQLAHLIIAHRPQHVLPQTGAIAELIQANATAQPSQLQQKLSGYIVTHPVTALEISATDIRQQFQLGLNPRYLLPNNVYNYIKQHSVYKASTL